MVIDDKITNEYFRKRFFNTPTIRYQLARRQLTFTGKVVRNSEDQIPTQLLTAWCENKRKPGAPLQKNKKNLTKNICFIVPGAAKDGLLRTWVYLALDDGYWAHLVRTHGQHHIHAHQEELPPLQHPPQRQAPPDSPPPSRARNPQFTPTPPRRNAPQPSPRLETSLRHDESTSWNPSDKRNYDPEKVGYTERDSLGTLNIPISAAATER